MCLIKTTTRRHLLLMMHAMYLAFMFGLLECVYGIMDCTEVDDHSMMFAENNRPTCPTHESNSCHFINYSIPNPFVTVYAAGDRGTPHLVGPMEIPSYAPTAEQLEIIEAMKWAWNGYKKHAWGQDVLDATNTCGKEWNGYNLGVTIVDSLDTLYIMNLTKEAEEAKQWILSHLKLDQDVYVNLFETTIRMLGGLLSALHMSGDTKLLELAEVLGSRLIHAFNSHSGIPYCDVNLGTFQSRRDQGLGVSSTSEVATIQLEFKYLSKLTLNKTFHNLVENVMEKIHKLKKYHGLVPILIDPQSATFHGSTISLGARGDSYYEYLLKQWLQLGRKDPKFRKRYSEAVDGIIEKLVRKSQPSGLTFIGELINGEFVPKMDHLVCFVPGMLALGAANGFGETHLKLAEELAYTCHEMYNRTATGLSPEIVYFNMHVDSLEDMTIRKADTQSITSRNNRKFDDTLSCHWKKYS